MINVNQHLLKESDQQIKLKYHNLIHYHQLDQILHHKSVNFLLVYKNKLKIKSRWSYKYKILKHPYQQYKTNYDIQNKCSIEQQLTYKYYKVG